MNTNINSLNYFDNQRDNQKDYYGHLSTNIINFFPNKNANFQNFNLKNNKNTNYQNVKPRNNNLDMNPFEEQSRKNVYNF